MTSGSYISDLRRSRSFENLERKPEGSWLESQWCLMVLVGGVSDSESPHLVLSIMRWGRKRLEGPFL